MRHLPRKGAGSLAKRGALAGVAVTTMSLLASRVSGSGQVSMASGLGATMASSCRQKGPRSLLPWLYR